MQSHKQGGRDFAPQNKQHPGIKRKSRDNPTLKKLEFHGIILFWDVIG